MAQKYGLLIDNYWCTGCHSCEESCKNEHDLPIGQFGIKMLVLGPWEKMEKGQWEHTYYPVLTSYCDLCADRVAAGKQPICVEACPLRALDFGDIEELRAAYGDDAEIAPLPAADETKPNLVITAPAGAKPVGDSAGEIMNELEIM